MEISPPRSECRSGAVIGLMSSTLDGLRRILLWTSEFAGEPAKSSLESGDNASNHVIDQVNPHA